MSEHSAENDAPTDEAVTALSEALYGADLEEILGVPDEALDDIARVVLSLGYVIPPGTAAPATADRGADA